MEEEGEGEGLASAITSDIKQLSLGTQVQVLSLKRMTILFTCSCDSLVRGSVADPDPPV
jgi:hypothetical protein